MHLAAISCMLGMRAYKPLSRFKYFSSWSLLLFSYFDFLAMASPTSDFSAPDLYGQGVRIGFYLLGVWLSINAIWPVDRKIPSKILALTVIALAIVCSQDALLARHELQYSDALAIFGVLHTVLLPSACALHAQESDYNTIVLPVTVLSLGMAQLSLGLSFKYTDTPNTSVIIGVVAIVFSFLYTVPLFLCWAHLVYRILTRKSRPPYIWHLVGFRDVAYDKTGNNERRYKIRFWVENVLRFFAFFSIIFPIAITESTIQFFDLNPKTDIISPAQFIPFLLGLIMVLDLLCWAIRRLQIKLNDQLQSFDHSADRKAIGDLEQGHAGS